MTPLDPAPIRSQQSEIRTPSTPPSSFVIRHSSFIDGHPWLTFLLPFIVYMAVGAFAPASPKAPVQLPNGASRPAPNTNWFGLEYRQYPIVYTAKIVLTIAAMVFVFPGYRRFPLRVSPLAIVVGVIGVVLWIALCQLRLEQKLLEP